MSDTRRGNQDNQDAALISIHDVFQIILEKRRKTGQPSFQGGHAMPKFKSVIAGLALSTAVTGGAVALGAATTATAANAGIVQVGCGGCGGGCGGGGGWGWGGRGRNRNHNRNWNRNHNRQHQTNRQNQNQRQFVINNIRVGRERDRGFNRGFDDDDF
ncbi:hypothetical protein ACQP25_40745 [Microtetraspora malaysiensis]|uniref:hypothetical protein n=1 Tax=Microtetraspora malaysiensis TaxID=161358 RepID=UPI003D8C228E